MPAVTTRRPECLIAARPAASSASLRTVPPWTLPALLASVTPIQWARTAQEAVGGLGSTSGSYVERLGSRDRASARRRTRLGGFAGIQVLRETRSTKHLFYLSVVSEDVASAHRCGLDEISGHRSRSYPEEPANAISGGLLSTRVEKVVLIDHSQVWHPLCDAPAVLSRLVDQVDGCDQRHRIDR